MSLVPHGNLGSLTCMKSQQPQEQHYPFLPTISVCPNNGMAARVWDLLTYAHTMKHPALKDDWDKNPLPHREIGPASVLRLAFWFDVLPAIIPTEVSGQSHSSFSHILLSLCFFLILISAFMVGRKMIPVAEGKK